MIKRKYNCEDMVNCEKKAVLKNSVFWKISSCEKVCLLWKSSCP